MTRLRAFVYAVGCVASLAVALVFAMAALDPLPASLFARALMLGVATVSMLASWACGMEAATRWPVRPP